jgi:hypothetical protein
VVPALAGLERQSGLGAIQRLDLGLVVDREHDRMLGRVDLQADDVLELGDEVRILGALEGGRAADLRPPCHDRDVEPLPRVQDDRARATCL